MNKGWEEPESGLDTEQEDDAAPTAAEAAPGAEKGGWVALPPDPDAPPGSPQTRRYRAPWATHTTVSTPRATPAPSPPEPAPEPTGFRAKAGALPAAFRRSAKTTPQAPEADPPRTPTVADMPPAPPEDAAPRAQPAPAPSGARALEFSGSAGEYFRVWIVNVCLTVLTLGIYSAWAKVRTKRYFYRHTSLDGSPFDYLAEPMQILKGRAVMVAFMGTYGLLGQFMPLGQGLMSIALIFLVPWAVVRSLKFRAQTSAWRNIRFGFDGTYREALAVFMGWPLLVAVTLGLAYPYYQWRRHRFITERSRFGTQSFAYGATAGEFYKMHMKIALMVLGLGVVAGLMVPVLMPVLQGQMAGGQVPVWAGLGVNVGAALVYFMVWTYARARTWNIVWNGTAVGPHRFRCTVRARDLFRLYLMNTLGIILSFGLLVPWARVRMAQYRVEAMQIAGGGSLTEFAQAQADRVGAAGAEFGEAMDLDLAL